MKKILSACAVAALAVVGLAGPAQAAQPLSAQMNNPAYWEMMTGDDCDKIEFANGVKTFTLPTLLTGDYTKLILKAGSGTGARYVVDNPGAGAYAHPSGKDLSHAIYCVGEDDPYYPY